MKIYEILKIQEREKSSELLIDKFNELGLQKGLERIKAYLVKEIMEELNLDSEQGDKLLKEELRQEIILAGWEGFLLAQITPVLLEFFKQWNVKGFDNENKARMVKKLIHFTFSLDFRTDNNIKNTSNTKMEIDQNSEKNNNKNNAQNNNNNKNNNNNNAQSIFWWAM